MAVLGSGSGGSVGAGAASPRFTRVVVAASDSTADEQSGADYLCDGTADDVQIQAAFDALPSAGGEVRLLGGTYTVAATIRIGYSPSVGENRTLSFADGATMRWTSGMAGAEVPIVQVLSSNSIIMNPRLQGSGSKGSGVGVKVGGSVQTGSVQGAYIGQPNGVHIYNPYISSMDTGVEFGVETTLAITVATWAGGSATFTTTSAHGLTATAKVTVSGVTPSGYNGSDLVVATVPSTTTFTVVMADPGGAGSVFGVIGDTESTGDCAVHGGRITGVKVGVKNRGFVNHVDTGCFISTVNIGVQQTTDRNSGRVNIHEVTINQWTTNAVLIERGGGSYMDMVWMEKTSGAASTAAIAFGSGSYTVVNPRIGFLHIHPSAGVDTYTLQLVRCRGLVADHIEITNDLPTTAAVRVDNHADNEQNIIHKLSSRDAAPSTWAFGQVLSNATSNPDACVIETIPSIATTLAAVPNAAAAEVLGFGTRSDPMADYTVFREGTDNTYYAKTRLGHVIAASADATSGTVNSGLKTVLETLLPNGTVDKTVSFGPGRFHFLDAPTGIESWAGVEDYMPYVRLKRVTFKGSGPATIISNRTNHLTASPDTEPFSFSDSQDITIRDMTVEGCGAFKSTTDVIDFDQGHGCRVENVTIKAARSNAIVVDGGDDGKTVAGVIIKNVTVKGRPSVPQVSRQTGGSALVDETDYRFAVGWRIKDLFTGTITLADRTGTSLLLTVVAHGQRVGESVVVSGCDVSAYDGTWTVATVVDVDNFTVTVPASGADGTTGTLFGSATTKPSDASQPISSETTGGFRTLRVTLEKGPYTYTGWDVYIWSAATGWDLHQTVAASDSTLYVDIATEVADAVTLTAHRSSVQDSGIKLLGVVGGLVEGCVVDGVGDAVNGSNGAGIYLSRKAGTSADPGNAADFNRVIGNRVRHSNKAGIYIIGGADNIVMGNEVSNPGSVATKAQGVRIEGAATVGANTFPTHRNLITNNRLRDDQDADSWSGGVSMDRAVTITSTNTPTDNRIEHNVFSGSASAAISDSGTTTRIARNHGYVTEAQGTGSIANGATTAVITHGLGYTPLEAEISVTFKENPTNTPGLPFITTITSTQFTVNVEADPGASNLDFGWMVRKL